MKFANHVFAAALLAAGALSNIAFAQSSCPAISVPASFSANEKLLAWGTDLTLKAGNDKFGTVVERTLHLTTTFDIQNASGQTVATAREKLFSWGTQIEVVDCAGQKIGTVKEEILKSLFKTWTSYKILDADGRQIATSEKLDLLATNFDLHRNDGTPVGTMHRPWINLLTDHWDVTYNAGSGIDPRLWLTIPAYKTAADNQRRAEENSRKNRDNDSNSTSMNTLSTEEGDTRDSKAIATLEAAPPAAGPAPGTGQRSI